jgi:hypothetical protein
VVLSVVKKNPARGSKKHDPEKGNCNDSCGPGDRLGSDGQSDPRFDLAALDKSATAQTAQPSAGIVFGSWTSDAVMVATSPDHPRSGPVARKWRGSATVYILRSETIDYERSELRYDIEKQEK